MFFYILLAVILIIVVIISIVKYLNYYPTLTISIDITNKNKMNNNDFLDYYIINYGTEKLQKHNDFLISFEQERINKSKNKEKQEKIKKRLNKNNYKAFKFKGYRTQTRYKQVNYRRYSYKVNICTNDFFSSRHNILNRIQFLKSNNYLITYNGYNKKNQRNALTKELRLFIKTRDNYSCQICNKYMPDEVGLHIDHIIPISKGGKSTPDNLRVLCSKCNSSKGSKT